METDISQIIEQDMKAAYSAFRKDDFRLMNIFANRIMTNAILSEDFRLTLVGFFLKETARICDGIKAREELTTFSTAKSLGDAYIQSIKLKNNINEFWEQYLQFYNRIRKHEQNEYEKKGYEKNVEFTHLVFRWLIEKLSKDRNMLFNDKNQFVRGIQNEMGRIIRVHGGELVDLYAWSLVKALQLYSDYMEYFKRDERKEIIKESLLPYIEDITRTLLKEPIDPKEVTLLIKRIILDWRLCYIHFMERPRFVPIREEPVPISEETKKKISETVAKSLEKEVK